MRLQSVIQNHRDDFKALCRRNHVNTLYAFGSAVGENFDPETSDIDLLVDLRINDPLIYGETLINLWNESEEFFGVKVDLLTEESVTNPYLKESIDAGKILIYDATGEEVFV